MSLSKVSKQIKESNQEIDETNTVGIQKMLQYDESSGQDHLTAYKDSKQIWTIGVGHNLHANDGYEALGRHLDKNSRITLQEQQKLFEWDLAGVNKNLSKNVVGFENFKPHHKAVLQNLNFQMGDAGVLKFKGMLKEMRAGNDSGVAQHILSSKMGRVDSPNRAKRLSQLAHGVVSAEYSGGYVAKLAKIKQDTSGQTYAQVKDNINKTAGVVGAVGVAGRNAGIIGAVGGSVGRVLPKIAESMGGGVKSIGKVASAIYDKISGGEDKKEPEEEAKKEALTVAIPKLPKHIAYDTQGLTGWQKRVIELTTDWANLDRGHKKDGEISLSQAAIGDSNNGGADKVAIGDNGEVKKEWSFSESLRTTPIERKVALLGALQVIQNDTFINTVDAIEKGKPKLPAFFKPNINPKHQKKNVSDTKLSEKGNRLTTAINEPLSTIDAVKPQPAVKPINTAIVNKPIVNNPVLNQSAVKDTKPKQRTIILNNSEDVTQDTGQQTTFVFGDRYDSRQDLKNIRLTTGEYGTGIFNKHL